MLFYKYLDKIYIICFTLKIKIQKHFHEISSVQLQVILLKHYRGGDEGGGGDIEKIEKEGWSWFLDCLSLLQICSFYINNRLVMKAILFCDEPYFRYIHEVGEETSAVGPKTIFPWLTNDGLGHHSSFHMMENKRWNPVKLLSFLLNSSITSGLSISLPPCLSMYILALRLRQPEFPPTTRQPQTTPGMAATTERGQTLPPPY